VNSMKKIVIITLSIIFTLALIGCSSNYHIKPVDDALVQYLDNEWVAVWADEFDGDALDVDKWNFEIGGGGWGNQELQYYTYTNHEVSDGTLKINVRNEAHFNRQYTSSRLTTKNKGDFKYGRIQVRAKLPEGRGLWPAIWMMPTENKFGGWPHSGEIDIMEYVGYQPNIVHSALHTSAYNGMDGNNHHKSLEYPTLEDNFKVFELIWEPGKITTYIDGFEIFKYVYMPQFNLAYEANEVFPFFEKFFLIINVAVGGSWGGIQGVDNSIFPQVFEIDYVRVYQRDYKKIDKDAPDRPTNMTASSGLTNSIIWLAAEDDYSIDHYEVYLDGELYGLSPLNQIKLKGLNIAQSYDIQVRAVDMTGKTSDLSDTFTYIYA